MFNLIEHLSFSAGIANNLENFTSAVSILNLCTNRNSIHKFLQWFHVREYQWTYAQYSNKSVSLCNVNNVKVTIVLERNNANIAT